ncbi:MAG: hypothetical protein GPJ54_06200 [Candidatus Heimdallarchaeota archaeon]|nr:hypothetical protein [Candidatus Heimdallarchaeota archaeon]
MIDQIDLSNLLSITILISNLLFLKLLIPSIRRDTYRSKMANLHSFIKYLDTLFILYLIITISIGLLLAGTVYVTGKIVTPLLLLANIIQIISVLVSVVSVLILLAGVDKGKKGLKYSFPVIVFSEILKFVSDILTFGNAAETEMIYDQRIQSIISATRGVVNLGLDFMLDTGLIFLGGISLLSILILSSYYSLDIKYHPDNNINSIIHKMYTNLLHEQQNKLDHDLGFTFHSSDQLINQVKSTSESRSNNKEKVFEDEFYDEKLEIKESLEAIDSLFFGLEISNRAADNYYTSLRSIFRDILFMKSRLQQIIGGFIDIFEDLINKYHQGDQLVLLNTLMKSLHEKRNCIKLEYDFYISLQKLLAHYTKVEYFQTEELHYSMEREFVDYIDLVRIRIDYLDSIVIIADQLNSYENNIVLSYTRLIDKLNLDIQEFNEVKEHLIRIHGFSNQFNDEAQIFSNSRNTINVEGIGLVKICCNNAARLSEIYCACGLSIPQALLYHYK